MFSGGMTILFAPLMFVSERLGAVPDIQHCFEDQSLYPYAGHFDSINFLIRRFPLETRVAGTYD